MLAAAVKQFLKMDSGNNPDTPTLTRHLLATLMNRTDIEGAELVSLLVTIQSIVKNIGSAVRRAGISRLFGTQGSMNVQGEEQQKLDILANQVNMVYWSSFATKAFFETFEMNGIL